MSEEIAIQGVSNKAINRAGNVLADSFSSTATPDGIASEQFLEAFQLVSAFRTAHQSPMNSTAMGLRSMIRTATGVEPVVAQRLKRVPRIQRKLARLNLSERTNLARLEDIGGCRAILPSIEDMDKVIERTEKNWGETIRRRRDYRLTPNLMGFRAYHVVISRRGRYIEVQLRTQRQQLWADEIERLDSRLGLTLKDGNGPPGLVTYFNLLSKLLKCLDYSEPIPPTLVEKFDVASAVVIEQGFYRRRDEK